MRAYLLQRWAAGCHIGVQLLADLHEQGYRGSLSSLYRAMNSLRLPRTWPQRQASPAPVAASPHTTAPASQIATASHVVARCAGRSCSRQSKKRTGRSSVRVCADAAVIYPLVQRLGMLIREHRVADLDSWLLAAKESGIPEFVRFARSLRRDQAAVSEALTSRWSQGQTEGFITKLKLLKRSMYGRAKMDLLRLRLVVSTTH